MDGSGSLHVCMHACRGFLLELLLTKLRRLTSLLNTAPTQVLGYEPIQVVGLSATLPNVREVRTRKVGRHP